MGPIGSITNVATLFNRQAYGRSRPNILRGDLDDYVVAVRQVRNILEQFPGQDRRGSEGDIRGFDLPRPVATRAEPGSRLFGDFAAPTHDRHAGGRSSRRHVLRATPTMPPLPDA